MIARHMTIEQLPYGKPVHSWLKDRYGETEADQIWEQGSERYTQISGRVVIRPGFQHCGYMAAHPKEYAEEIEAFIRRRQDVLG